MPPTIKKEKFLLLNYMQLSCQVFLMKKNVSFYSIFCVFWGEKTSLCQNDTVNKTCWLKWTFFTH